MLNVKAKCDIVTDKGFTIATCGLRGTAKSGIAPHDSKNYGKVLVYFDSREHGYWVRPEQLSFPTGTKIEEYVAFQPEQPKPPVFPLNNVRFAYNFGKNIQMLRTARELSQAELGALMGKHGLKLAQSTVCYRENSSHCPGGKFVNAVANALGVPAFVMFLPLDNTSLFGDARRFIGCVSSSLCEG